MKLVLVQSGGFWDAKGIDLKNNASAGEALDQMARTKWTQLLEVALNHRQPELECDGFLCMLMRAI